MADQRPVKDNSAHETSRVDFHRTTVVGDEAHYLGQVIAGGQLQSRGPFSHRATMMLEAIHPESRVLLTSSCTAALDLAALTLRLAPGDEVIVPAYTFVATAGAFALSGVRPVFVDVDPHTLGLDATKIEEAVTERTKAVCLVHYGGVPAHPEDVAAAVANAGLALIEDNAHGTGGRSQGKPLGTFGSLGALSFSSQKNVTCGEGGALVINDLRLLERAEVASGRGTNKAQFLRGEIDSYEWVDSGSNWDLGELAAAVLVAQLEEIEAIQRHRLSCWQTYASELSDWASDCGVMVPQPRSGDDHTAHIYHLRLLDRADRDAFISHMGVHGVTVVPHYHALNTSVMGRQLGGECGQCPVAEHAAQTLVRLPLHGSLDEKSLARIVDAAISYRRR